MKIFAKRTKKKVEGPRTVNKSDPIVEELLKKESSEWNAKERRMIKRYRDRKVTESSEVVVDTSTSVTDEKEKTEETTKENEEGEEDVEQEECDYDKSASSSDDDNDDANKDDDDNGSSSDNPEGSNKKEVKTESTEQNEATELPNDNPPPAEKVEKNDDPAVDKTTDDDGMVDKDHEIWSVLDKLNSKQKRTLSRKLERLGKSVLEAVEKEANKILDEIIPVPVDSKRDQTEAASTDKNASSEPKKKKQKKGADWSRLPAEERLRREEQRKKQEEAAERRALGKSIKPGHKRPLNSERRRANRRKPKWGVKSPAAAPVDSAGYKQEHHSSGFNIRKNRGVEQQATNDY